MKVGFNDLKSSSRGHVDVSSRCFRDSMEIKAKPDGI